MVLLIAWMWVACFGDRGEHPLDATLRRGDLDAVAALLDDPALGPAHALRDWFERHPAGTRYTLRGEPVGRRGGVRGLLGARLYARPERWDGDRWPLGALLRLTADGVEDARADSAARRITGEITFEAAERLVRGSVTLHCDAGLVGFVLGTPGSAVRRAKARCRDREVPLTHSSTLWAAVLDDDCDLHLDYELDLSSPQGFDLWSDDALVLGQAAWMPSSLAVGSPTEVDVTLVGLAHWTLRGATTLERDAVGWRVHGTDDELAVLAGRPTWVTLTGIAEGVTIEVAVSPGSDPGRILARAMDAVKALRVIGELPDRIGISEVPKGRAPHAALRHVALPAGRLREHPLALAHEIGHLLLGRHSHTPAGRPTLEEPLVELLSLRASRDAHEARTRRRAWQAMMLRREGDDGRPLSDAWRLQVAHYYRGALVLGALGDRIGTDVLLDTMRPLPEVGATTWPVFVRRVASRHPEAGAWLREVVSAQNLPRLDVVVAGGETRLVDAGDTGVPLTVDVVFEDPDGVTVLETGVVGAALVPPPGATRVLLDPDARAPIRRRRDARGRPLP